MKFSGKQKAVPLSGFWQQDKAQQLKPRLKDLVAWIFRRRQRYTIEGSSMEPFLQKGDAVLVKLAAKAQQFHVGDVVVANHPFHRSMTMVKAITHLDAQQKTVQLSGVNPAGSTDSRSYGAIPIDSIVGVVTTIL